MIFIIIIAIIGVSIIATEQQTNRLSSQELLAQDIQTRSNNLVYISSDYFLYQDNSDLNTWQTEFSGIASDLSKTSSLNTQQQAIISTIEADAQRLNASWSSVASYLQNAPRNESVRVVPVFQDDWSIMSSQNQALIFNAQQLSQNFKTQVDQSNLTNILLISALLSLFGAYFIINYLITYRSTLKSISELQKGIAVIGSGNLDYSLKAGNKDEVSAISGSVNQMAANLKAVTASKTDLELAQTSLRESEQRWATTLASIGDAVIATDTSGKIMFMNGEAEQLTGWTLSEVSQKPVKTAFNIINEQTRLGVESPIERVLREGIVVGLANHTVLIRKDGAEVPIDDSGAPIKDKDGKTTGVVLIFRDITERKKTEKALLKAKEQTEFDRKRLETILETSPSAVVIIDASSGKFSYVNKRAMQLYGFDTLGLSLDENVAKVKARRADGTDYPIEEMPVSRSLTLGEEVHNAEMMIERPDGQAFPIIASTAPLRDMKGNIIAAIVVFEDITERKKEEEAVARQAALIDLSPDAIIVQELNGTITFWSKGAEKLYGWTKDEAIGKNIHTLLKTEFRPPLEEILNKVKLDGKWSGELVHISKDGTKVTEQSYWLAKFGSDGKIVEMLESNVDITDRIELQAKLEESAVRLQEYANQMEDLANQRAAQLKDAERLAAIGATAGMVGHDIRNPLQAITGDVFLAKTDLIAIPESEEKQAIHESLTEIEKNVDYINKIVQDLQDYARPLNPNPAEADLQLIIDKLLQKNGVPETVKVSVKVEDEARKIVADADYLNRILYNLVINAVQAMPNGGKLAIRVKREANDVIISVKDTGVGIPEAVRGKLFTPMFTTKSKGQGFGLPVVKRMTESLGGTVSFESQEGKGTTFIVRLPPQGAKR